MKKYLLFILLSITSIQIFAQANLFTNNGPDDVVKVDSRLSQIEFVPNQVLVKFKDDAQTVLQKSSGRNAALGVASVDGIFVKYGVTKAEKLFPDEKRKMFKRTFKISNGKEIEEKSLHNIYKLQFTEASNVFNLIEELKQDNNVEYAEPNYLLSIVDSKPVSPELTEKEMLEWVKTHNLNPNLTLSNDTSLPPNDPLYSQQWYINAVQADSVWKQTTGDTTQVIAILDTGVDWLHPDLKNKIWTNHAEIADNGIDDDGDGFVDDVRGWDFVNFDNNPRDDNAHGTHVTGIVAAEGNNNLGIAGVSWGAKIMPIKVMNNNGYGDVSNLALGINYASNKKANIINMSLGYYWRSMTVENALTNALVNNCVLVAAAGNGNYSIYDITSEGPKTFYPAALSYVLGIQSTDRSYSNYDPDGPIYSQSEEGINYELSAPGTGILSCVPGGGYRIYTGTSMATPIVSGSIALYNSIKKNSNNEDLWGDLIHSSTQFNINSAIFKTTERAPKFDLVKFSFADTLGTDDRDSQVDAGEEIDLWITVRNTFGKADSAFCKIELDPVSKPYYENELIFISQTSFIGSMAAYAKRTNQSNPFRLKFKSTFPNEANLELRVLMWDAVVKDTFYQTINVRVYNGTELAGIINHDITLTPDRLWIINNSVRLGSGYNMKILPGTHIINNATFDNRGTVEAIGKPDSLILIEGNFFVSNGKYIRFELKGQDFSGGSFEKCSFYNGKNYSGVKFNDCYFLIGNKFISGTIEKSRINGFGNQFDWGTFLAQDSLIDCDIKNSAICHLQAGKLKGNNFYNTVVYPGDISFPQGANYKFNNFVKFINVYIFFYPTTPISPNWGSAGVFTVLSNTTNYQENSFIMNPEMKLVNPFVASGNSDLFNLSNIYWGTNQKQKIDKFNIDFIDNAGLPIFNYEPMLVAPPDSCHGIVWKVLVNGKDAQDEVVDPLGAATHRFDVYFNRPMDKNYVPQITFGVREPYTQQSVALNGSWSADGKIYTAYKKVELYTGDGINRVRVAGARDLEDFEIPVEDMRFEFLIDAAGSASIDFLANAGIGKVQLEWPTPGELPTLLGYNIYRFTNLTDTTFTDTTQVNTQLVTDTTYTDFNVEPHKKYYYLYKVVRTDFTESDFSKVVNATVLTASRGDANGSMDVDVMDIVSIVAYILNQNPQPFIFDAADLNQDKEVSILDIVGVVNIMLGKSPSQSLSKEGSVLARLEIKDDKLTLQSESSISGIQFTLKGKNLDKIEFNPSNEINRFETANGGKGDTVRTFLIYSLNNNVLVPGSYTLGAFTNLDDNTKIEGVVISDESGKGILTNVVDKGVQSIPTEYYLSQNYPNPFNPTTKMEYGLPAKSRVKIVIYNILGQRVKTIDRGEENPGRYQVMWDGKNEFGQLVSSGVYIYRIETSNYFKAKKMLLLK